MDGQDRIDREVRVAVTGGEQHHLMTARHQPLGQIPAMRLHPAQKGLPDRLADVGEQRDPHAAARPDAARSSSRRMTLAVFA